LNQRIKVIWSTQPIWSICIFWYFSSVINSINRCSNETIVGVKFWTFDFWDHRGADYQLSYAASLQQKTINSRPILPACVWLSIAVECSINLKFCNFWHVNKHLFASLTRVTKNFWHFLHFIFASAQIHELNEKEHLCYPFFCKLNSRAKSDNLLNLDNLYLLTSVCNHRNCIFSIWNVPSLH
jgi:hypothetical protein